MSMSRREFLAVVPVAGACIALKPFFALRKTPVLSFHLDRPYLDLTGMEKAYRPPDGTRSGAPLAAIKDEQWIRYYGQI